MDYYVSKFREFKKACQVIDYAVYLQKKTGFDRFNPFSAHTQLVIINTNTGNYCQQIRSSGEFSCPQLLLPDDIHYDADGKFVKVSYFGSKLYKFTRKMKHGKYRNFSDFSHAVKKIRKVD